METNRQTPRSPRSWIAPSGYSSYSKKEGLLVRIRLFRPGPSCQKMPSNTLKRSSSALPQQSSGTRLLRTRNGWIPATRAREAILFTPDGKRRRNATSRLGTLPHGLALLSVRGRASAHGINRDEDKMAGPHAGQPFLLYKLLRHQHCLLKLDRQHLGRSVSHSNSKDHASA